MANSSSSSSVVTTGSSRAIIYGKGYHGLELQPGCSYRAFIAQVVNGKIADDQGIIPIVTLPYSCLNPRTGPPEDDRNKEELMFVDLRIPLDGNDQEEYPLFVRRSEIQSLTPKQFVLSIWNGLPVQQPFPIISLFERYAGSVYILLKEPGAGDGTFINWRGLEPLWERAKEDMDIIVCCTGTGTGTVG